MAAQEDRRLRFLVKWLLEGSIGGRTRARILLLLHDRPLNPNQLARLLGVNYRTVTHHLRVLEEHGFVERVNRRHGAPYVLTEYASRNWRVVRDSICRVLGGDGC